MTAGKKLSIQDFIERASTVHDNKYDYSESVYVNTHTKLTIGCPVHGKFEQLPYDHLRGGGCVVCSGKQRTSQSDFVSRAKQAIGEQYDFSGAVYKNLSTPVTVICPDHGEFTKSPRLILQQNRGCPSCGQDRYRQKVKSSTLTTQQFVDRATLIHGSNYSYINTEYVTSSVKVRILCPNHGEFTQLPSNHLQGQGCPICSNERNKITCGGNVKGKLPTPSASRYTKRKREATGKYNQQWFEKFPDSKLQPAQFYCIEVEHDTDHFIKVGITTRTIKQRFQRTGTGETIIDRRTLDVKYMSLYDAYVLEQHILRELKGHQYFPNYVLDGYTECFKLSARDQVLDLMKQHLAT